MIMKRLALFLVVCFSISSVFAQEYKEVKNEGIVAYKAKDYTGAITSFKKSLELVKQGLTEDATNAELVKQEKDLTYNIGMCYYKNGSKSKKAEDYNEAIKYLDVAIAKKYHKKGNAYVYKANAYKKLKDDANMIASLKTGYEVAPQNKNIKKMLAQSYMKAGLEYYNKANKFLEAGTATQEAEARTKEYAKAAKAFDNALPYFTNAYILNSTDQTVQKALKAIYENQKKEEAAELEKLKTEKVNLDI